MLPRRDAPPKNTETYEMAITRLLLIQTRSGKMDWIKKPDDTYHGYCDTIWANAHLCTFQAEVRGHPRIVLNIDTDGRKTSVYEPEPHISAVPLGKILYILASCWNCITPSSLHFFVPKEPQTAKEKENEKLRLALQELHKTVSEQF